MAVEDIENKVRKMSSQKPEDGKDLQQLQEAQNQIVQINAERQGNLQTARLENNADAANNETMSQAVEMAALGGLGGGAAVQQQVQAMNPQTQAVLGKYGLGQPKVQRTSSRSVQVTPQKITINNNTTNTTTNNVAVPAANIGGPVQGRTLAVKQNPDEGQARFKTWISNAFAKQNQQAAAREKEYQRREWSLTRSTNKLMKHLSDLGKSVSERLDPRKLASSVGGQFKTILFLFGTMFLAKNWKRIIKFAANVETFFFGEPDPQTGERGEPGFKKFFRELWTGENGIGEWLVGAFGGKKGESLGEAFKNLFWNDKENGILQLLGKAISNFFKERGDAVKAIKIPELNLQDMPGTLKSMVQYLGDILKALVGGADAVKSSIGNSINRVSIESERNFGIGNNIGHKVEDRAGGIFSNTSLGDKVLTEKKDGKTAVHVLPGAIDSDGNLTDKVSSSISQANSLAYSSSDMAKKTGYVETAKVSAGLSRLNNAIIDKGTIPVSQDFLNEYLTVDQIENLRNSGNIINKKFKYHKRKKTKEELAREGAGDFLETAGKSMIFNNATQLGDGGLIYNTGKAMATGNPNHIVGPNAGAILNGSDAVINKWVANKYTYELVPLDAPVTGEKRKDGTVIGYEYPVIDKKVIDTIRQNIGGGTSFELSDKDYTTNVQSYLENKFEGSQRPKIYDLKTGEQASNYDMDIDNVYKDLDNVIKNSKKRSDELKNDIENSPMKRVGEHMSNTIDSVKDYFSGKIKKYPALAKNQKEFVDKMRAVYKDVLMKKGIDTKYADVLTAQSALESAWGKSQSGKFNFSGIKADKDDIDKGLYTVCKTTEYENGVEKKIYDKFRDFKSLEDFAEYKVNFVNRDRYKAFDGDSINDYINRVVKGGYATAPNYGEILADTVKNIQSNYPDESLENPPVINDIIKPTTSPDASGTYLADNNSSISTIPDNYVEQKTDKGSSIPTYDWNTASVNSFGSDSGLIMAQSSILAPEKVTPTTPTSEKSIPGNTSESAGRELIADAEKDRTEDLYIKVSDINESIKLLSKTSIAQAEAINNVSTAIASLKFGGNINMGGGDGRTKVQSITTPPYRG
jgi:flagellum-specific peptidoglycan hydrolase FlgJ